MEISSNNLPVYKIIKEGQNQGFGTAYVILAESQAEHVHQTVRDTFAKDGEATYHNGNNKTVYLTLQKASKTVISTNSSVSASKLSGQADDYFGSISDFLSSAYKFSRKSKKSQAPTISIEKTTPRVNKVISLVEARNQTRQWGNGRGDVEGTPQYFRAIAQKFAQEHKDKGVSVTVISGDDLIKEGFRLLHAVGRASKNEPTFVNLSYKGIPDSNEWIAYVGKGVCFDTGGYNIKTSGGILDMFLDKCGAVTVLSAFQAIVREKLAINLTCSIGLVQNFISENAYRPSDIITSRKGLTVQIGNTDAEGRLVLADCMHWTQQKYKTKVLIELSTLTGAMITALGAQFAGLFTNDKDLAKTLKKIGEKVHEQSWHMPCTEYHKKLVTPKHCDLTNNSGNTQASASQAAAFLKSFVEEGTKWVHLDIAGAGMQDHSSTGWGTRLLIQYARSVSKVVPKQAHQQVAQVTQEPTVVEPQETKA